MRHGAGYRSVPWDPGEMESSTEGRGGLLEDRVEGSRWYKVSVATAVAFCFGSADRGEVSRNTLKMPPTELA